MANAGTLTVTLTSNQSQFVSGIKEAHGTLQKFGNDGVKQTGGTLLKFNASALESRKNIKLLAEAAGTATGPLIRMVEGFSLAPGPIGLAIAAFFALKEVMELNAEASAEASKKQDEYVESINKANELLGRRPQYIGAAAEVNKSLDDQYEMLKVARDVNIIWEAIAATMGGTAKSVADFEAERAKNVQVINERINALLKERTRLAKEGEIKIGKPKPEHHGGGMETHFQAAIGGLAAGVFETEHAANPQLNVLKSIDNGIKTINNNLYLGHGL